MKNLTSQNLREFLRQVSKIVSEWNAHLEVISRIQAIENCRQYLLLRTDILQKTVVGCLCIRTRLSLKHKIENPGHVLTQVVEFPQ